MVSSLPQKGPRKLRDELKAITFLDHRGQERALPGRVEGPVGRPLLVSRRHVQRQTSAVGKCHVLSRAVGSNHAVDVQMLIDVQDAEADILKWLLERHRRKSYKFTDLKPLVVPTSSIVMKGDTLRADVLLSAFDPTKKAEIFVENANWSGTAEEYTMDPENVMDTEGLMSLDLDSLGIGKLANVNQEHGFRGLCVPRSPQSHQTRWFAGKHQVRHA